MRLKTQATATPAIASFTDIDLYKLTMGQFVWRHHPTETVTYTFTNRDADCVSLAHLVPEEELRAQIAHARSLTPTDQELSFLRETGLFDEAYLNFLREIVLPQPQIERAGNQYRINVTGPWPTAIYWETMVLAIVNELRNGSHLRHNEVREATAQATGERRLREKLDTLRRNGVTGVTDFGTRRRFSGAWHRKLLEIAATDYPDVLVGTSNVHLAGTLGLPVRGTFAHEMPMAYGALAETGGDEAVRASHGQFLDRWYGMYGNRLSIALTDTFGADFFFSDMGGKRLHAWRGLRHDSGDPFAWIEQTLTAYRAAGVDPREKLLLFSDGLDAERIIQIHETYSSAATLGYGWGTNLTNDLGVPPTSMVMKLTEINGHRTVKLSDNLAKATGQREKIERYTRIFDHPGARYERTRY